MLPTMFSSPLRSRFGITSRIEYYSASVLTGIIKRSAGILLTDITSDGAKQIAGRSRGTPRIANNLLRRIRDFADVKGTGVVDEAMANYGLNALHVDEYGLDEMDNRILETMIDKFAGGPVGISTIATAVGEEPGTIEEVYEPFLIQEGFLKRTPRGREATQKAYTHLGRTPPASEARLFDCRGYWPPLCAHWNNGAYHVGHATT